MSDARRFLIALWPAGIPAGEKLIVTTGHPGRADKPSTSYATPEAIADAIERTDTRDRHVWLNVATRTADTSSRGTTADCRTLPALWADLDILEGAAPGAHSDGGGAFNTWADARAALARFPITPTAVVNTGNGLQAWWMLTEPVDATTGTELLARMRATMLRITEGRADRGVFDLARMMRLPGTYNVKGGECRPVILEALTPAARYAADDLTDEYLDTPEPAAPAASAFIAADDTRPGDLYNARASRADVEELLKDAGCTYAYTDGNGSPHYARPGKDPRDGTSLQVGGTSSDGHVFPENVTTLYSTGWAALPAGTYTPFRLLAHLRFRGDFTAAARFLADNGYTDAKVEPARYVPAVNDADLAEAFVRTTSGRYVYALGIGWLAWDGRRFVPISEAVLLVRLSRFVKSVLARLAADGTKDDDPTTKAVRAYLNVRARQRLITEAAGHLEVPADSLDATPGLLNTPTGIVNLATGELLPHDPAHRMTKMTRADYRPDATSPDWTKALAAVTDDVADYLRVALGATTIGEPVADQVYIALGSGGNGKSTVFGAVEHALGDYATTIPAKLFVTEPGRRENQLLMPLRGARLALAAESGEDHYLNMERLKALSGGDRITDRHLYAKEWATWTPTHTLWLMTNYRPRVRNSDEGTWRRLRLIPFTSSFVKAGDRDTGLRERLRRDDNAAAVLAWLTAGARQWLASQQLPQSLEVDRATEQWRDDEDIIAVFLNEAGYTVTGDYHNDHVPADELYRDIRTGYRTWAENAGRKALSAANFKAEMERYAHRLDNADRPSVRYRRTKFGASWRGLRLATSDDLARLEDDPADTATTPAEMPW